MGGTRGADMEERSAPDIRPEAVRVDAEQDHVVELEPLRGADVRDLNAGGEGEVLIGDELDVGDLSSLKRLVPGDRVLLVEGEEGDVRAGLAPDEIAQGPGEPGHRLAHTGEAEVPNRSAVTGRLRRNRWGEVAQDVVRASHDRARGTVADLQR